MAIRHVPISDSLSFGWKKTFEHFGFIITFIVVAVLAQIVFGIVQAVLVAAFAKTAMVGLIALLLAVARLVLNVVIGMAGIQAGLQIVAGKRPTIKGVFRGMTDANLVVNYILVSFVVGVIVALGLILFIIPGIYLALKYVFANYLVVDQKASLGKALSKGGDLTRGVKFELLGFIILTVLVNFVGLLALGIGLVVTIPMTQIAKTYVYKHLMRKA